MKSRINNSSRSIQLFRRPFVNFQTIGPGFVLLVFFIIAIFAPLLLEDITELNLINRLAPPDFEYWFGLDHLGRDVFNRTLYGTRISLIVGFSVAVFTTGFGMIIGSIAGFSKRGGAIIMRIMDGMMAIPSILLAIALMALVGSSLQNVIIAITIPETPRMVRLVRSVVLVLKEQLYVEAAVTAGTSFSKIIIRHILPNAMGPIIVQATYVCASAIITESLLSFLGAGTPLEIPSWGNMMAEGRQLFRIAPWVIGFPGCFLALLVLAVNILGDSLREILDPRILRKDAL